jgi:chorismate mutase
VSERFDEIRARILANDERIVAAVNDRLELVRELWRLKAELGAERIDRGRELALRAALAETNAGPLSPAGLDRLVGALLDLTKQELEGGEP